jgi:hypothetical protein
VEILPYVMRKTLAHASSNSEDEPDRLDAKKVDKCVSDPPSPSQAEVKPNQSAERGDT